MIQVLRFMLSLGCMLGGQYIAPFIMPFINPMGWIVYIIILLCCFFCPPNPINSKDLKTVDFTQTVSCASSSYYAVSVLLLCVFYGAVCKIDSMLPI